MVWKSDVKQTKTTYYGKLRILFLFLGFFFIFKPACLE